LHRQISSAAWASNAAFWHLDQSTFSQNSRKSRACIGLKFSGHFDQDDTPAERKAASIHSQEPSSEMICPFCASPSPAPSFGLVILLNYFVERGIVQGTHVIGFGFTFRA